MVWPDDFGLHGHLQHVHLLVADDGDRVGDGEKSRQEEWTDSIAVGSRVFVEKVKALLGFRAKGRDIKKGSEGYQVREGRAANNALFGSGKRDIGPQNAYFWDINTE